MIPKETVDLILDTARIEEVVGDFVTLKRRGANYVACCPFHNEKTPSFNVNPARGIYKCFGCGKAGSAVGCVISGWTEGMKLVGEGGKITLVIPADMAYGDRGQGPIGPNATLVFDVDLLEVHPFVAPAAE